MESRTGPQRGAAVYRLLAPTFIDPKIFRRVQEVLTGHNRPKYSKQEIAFRGLMTCAHDGYMLTGDVQKQKYIYYRFA